MCWNPVYALLMLLSTVLTYVCGLCMEHRLCGQKKLWLVLSLVLNLAILFVFKYFNFFADTIAAALKPFGLGAPAAHLNLLLPVGISFYTFQALGYTIDVYRGTVAAERNFITYALFVSFFPQLVAGPIERSGSILPQLKQTHRLCWDDFASGIVPIFWGVFKKMVIADNLAVAVNAAYNAPADASALQLALATVLFAFQIYCDFSAYSDIARGSAKMFGIELMQNFDRPYLATSIRSFWQRWHRSLSTWFKDYIYFPLGGSRVGLLRRCANLFVVFLISGLWHGAALTFVVWGALHGLYQVVGTFTRPARQTALRLLKIPESSRLLAVLRCAVTFALVCFAWIWFRANSVSDAVCVIQRIFLLAPGGGSLVDQFVGLGISQKNWIMLFCALLLLTATDFFAGPHDWEARIARCTPLRYGVLLALIAAVLLFGAYGESVSPQAFVYFQF